MLFLRRPHIYFCIGLIATVALYAGREIGGALWTTSRTISAVPTRDKVVAITIDDGPHSATTPEILAVLREKKAPATFFVLGVNAEKYPRLIAQELLDGHEIGIHGYSHTILTKLPTAKIAEELAKTEKAVMAVGPKPALFRPPGGICDEKVATQAMKMNYTIVLWSVDPVDWSRPAVKTVVDCVMANVKPGTIILLHDGQYPLPTAKALGHIIDRLRDDGYTLVTVSELLKNAEVRYSY